MLRPELSAELLCLVKRNLTIEVTIGFVASDHQEDVLVICVLTQFLDPFAYSIKAFSIRDIINKDGTMSISVVIPR